MKACHQIYVYFDPNKCAYNVQWYYFLCTLALPHSLCFQWPCKLYSLHTNVVIFALHSITLLIWESGQLLYLPALQNSNGSKGHWEGEIFLREHAPRLSYIMACFACHSFGTWATQAFSFQLWGKIFCPNG